MAHYWDHPLDRPLESVTSLPERRPTQLQLIDMDDDVPQLYDAHEHPKYPAELVRLTDGLHDTGHVELGLQVLAQYTRLERLVAFARFLLEA